MAAVETYKPAFTEPPGTNLAGIPIKGLVLPSPDVSYGLPYYEACKKHVNETFKASKVYIIASGSLARNTDKVDKLVKAIGDDKVVGIRRGIIPHTPWSDILNIAKECRDLGADCVVTLGAGSITDGAKIVVLVCVPPWTDMMSNANHENTITSVWQMISMSQVSLLSIPWRARKSPQTLNLQLSL
jgi:alcohol dehydrogenase class IV